METLIVICLVIVIGLLLEDRIVIRKAKDKKALQEPPASKKPSILGLPKSFVRLSLPKTAVKGQDKIENNSTDNFEWESENKAFSKQIPQEEPDEGFGKGPDLWEEEEEWSRYGISDGGDGFATGVTFEELGTVGMVLRQEVTESSLQEQAVATVHKIQGTELFSLLEQSMEGASQKIAALLDKSLSSSTESGSSILRNNNFDIEEFL
ncbi:conjugal transfer protein TraD [Chryseobacterium sp. SL1]|nr:conjugal transfer protein TraD [Chryseobacterium sp. SL1]